MSATNVDNTSGAINTALYGEGGELHGTKENEVVDSTGVNKTVTIYNADGDPLDFNPDQLVNLGDGYTLMIEAKNSQAVVVDQQGNMVDVWGDPHVRRTNADGSTNGAFEFINNMTFYLPNDKKITMETSTDTVNGGMTWTTGVQIFDPDGAEGADGTKKAHLTVIELDKDTDTTTVQTFTGGAAQTEENKTNDGVEAHVKGNLNTIDFYNEDGSAASGDDDPFAKGKQMNDTETIEIGLVNGVRNEVIEGVFDMADIKAELEKAGLPPESDSIMLVLFIIFQQRQENIQDYMKVQVDSISGDNELMKKVNALLTSLTGATKGKDGVEDVDQTIQIKAEEYKFMVEAGILDPNADRHGEGMGKINSETGNYDNAKIKYIKQALNAKAEELQNMTNQSQQKMQYTSGNLNSTSEAIYSFIESYTRTIKSGATKVGNG